MGQQQLLLLVLATVIVGLATVAGIQAFDEGQSQATQDALTQRALQIGNDLYSVAQKPSQLGGVALGGDAANAASAAGYEGTSNISADGAGNNADCEIVSNSNTYTVKCASDGATSNASGNEYVEAKVDSDGPSIVTINDEDITT